MAALASGRVGDWIAGSDEPRRLPPDAVRNDAIVAGLLAGAAVLTLWLYGIAYELESPPIPLLVGWVVCITLPLALRRRFPVVVALLVSVTFIVGGSTGVHEFFISNIALFLAIYSVGAWSAHRGVAVLARAAITAAMLVWLVLVIVWQSTSYTDDEVAPMTALAMVNLIINLLFFGAAWWFGDNAWRSAQQRALLERRSVELEQERERTAEQAVALERLRIARELHDAVAHHVSVMGVQAAAARRVLGTDPSVAATTLEAIETSARHAVDELHGLLHALRDPDAAVPDAAAAPVPGAEAASTMTIARIRTLVDTARTSGQEVDLQIIGEPRPLGPSAALAVYRIVQESLTNVRKHARGRRADVRLRWEAASLEVEVANDGLVPRRTGRGGFGLLGMRERIAAVGGAIDAGPKPRGGWRVRATVPAEPVPAEPVPAEQVRG